MKRMLKINAAVVIVTAALVATLFALDGASRSSMNALPLTTNTLAEIRGASPNYAALSGNIICACLFVKQNGLQNADTCDCTAAPEDFPCIVCSGINAPSGNYSKGATGLQPSGGTLPCNVMTAMGGSCAAGFCVNPIINLGPCVGDFPTFEMQVIVRRDGPRAGDPQPILGSFPQDDLHPLPSHATESSTCAFRPAVRTL